MNLSGKMALVTGAASGLGAATARAFFSAGAKVALLDRRAREVDALARELGTGAVSVTCDVSDELDVDMAFKRVGEVFGALHVAVNCAGVPSAEKLLSKGQMHSVDLWRKVIDVNLTGTFNVMRGAAAMMAANAPEVDSGDRGVIINTSSGAAYDGQRGQVAYAASKAGVAGLTLPAARDLAEHAIRCVAIAPGLFDTEMVGDIPPKAAAALQRQLLYPNRMGHPAEFAALAVHIVENRYFNAAVLRFDGGTRLAAN